MKAFGLSLVLLVLGAAAATAQTTSLTTSLAASLDTRAAAPAAEKEPSLEAASQDIGSPAAGEIEHSRLATRPPTPLVRK